jgi:eukaryotic-like serine/threonine-protein kinase
LICNRCRQPVDANRKFCGKCGAPTGDASRSGDEPTFVPVRMNDVLEGKWRLERKLGEGGMGTVYLAHDLQLDRKVAIKILASSLAGDSELVTRFEREARLTASLEHPNIVPVYAVGEMEGRPFIVMKKLEGRTLAAYLRECGALPGDEVLALMRQLCSGLDFIHARGFIHRDIKSGNIFIGPDGLATILDFGILRTSENAEALTRTGMVMGTPQYMSPEQALGAREIDHRADLYALAVLLFECLTGTLPFEAESELSLIQMQAHAPPPELIDRAPWVPPSVAEVVKRALAKRPEERYASAGELLVALEDAYDGRVPVPAESSHPSPPVAVASGSASDLTQMSLKRLAADTPGSVPAASMPDRVASGRPRPGASFSSVTTAAASAWATAVADGEESSGTPDLENLAPKRRAPAIVAAIALAALLLGGYVVLGRSPSRNAPPSEIAGTAQAKPGLNAAAPASVDAGLDLQEGLDLREDQHAEAASDGGGALVSARAEVGNGNGEDASDDSEDPNGEVGSDTSHPRGGAKHFTARKLVVAQGSGTLNLITTLRGEPYWASVSVDGVRKGNTPLLLDLPPGKHRIHVERSGFQPVNKQVKIASGRSRLLRVELTP